ncbi:MAG TPA: CdaR family protein [Candidatus Limnocylindria bacterium]|nr:CdaR family protein [Candidatus Limnocylindria bacterium]
MRGPTYASTRRGGLRRIDLRGVVLNDLPTKAAALAIAVLAFVAVAESTPAEATATFRVPVERPTDVPAGYVLRATLGEVSVSLRGPQSQIAKLGPAELHPVPDLKQADLSRNDVQDVAVRVPLSDGIVAQTDPLTVPVRLEKVVSRSLTAQVRFANDPPSGFQAGAPSLSTSEVRITGAQSLVASVAAVFATLRFGDTPIDISTSADAVAVDAAGNAVDGVQADPPTVTVNVRVLSTTSTRTVPVLWSLKGAVASGYWISRVTTDPIAVQLQGTPDRLAAVDRVETAAIDVAGLNANRSFRVPLLLPDGVSLLLPTDATVGVTVIPLSGTRPFPVVAVQLTGLAVGLIGETDVTTVGVVVAGPAATLAALGPTDVGASVDASGKGAGSYQADVVLRLPPGVTVVSVQPTRVTLTIRSK